MTGERFDEDETRAAYHRRAAVELLGLWREAVLDREPRRAATENELPLLATSHLERISLVAFVRAERREQRGQAPDEHRAREFAKVVRRLSHEGLARSDLTRESEHETKHGDPTVNHFRRPALKRENLLRRLHLCVDRERREQHLIHNVHDDGAAERLLIRLRYLHAVHLHPVRQAHNDRPPAQRLNAALLKITRAHRTLDDVVLQDLTQVLPSREFLERERAFRARALERRVRGREHRERRGGRGTRDRGGELRDVQRAQELGEAAVTERPERGRRRRARLGGDGGATGDATAARQARGRVHRTGGEGGSS